MATVTVNVQANTSDATQDVNKLDTALEGADRAAEDLNKSLEKQEARIKTLGGAINILGGSVELLAAGLSVSGALTEEQAENFTKVAAEALLFADGSKRVFEGVKELNEGLSGLGGITGVVTKAFNRLKVAALANPYTALAIALAAVTAAVVAFTRETKDEITEAEKLNEKLDRQITLYKGVGTAALGADVKLAQLQASAEARNITLERAIELERQRAKETRDEANAELIRLESLRGSQRLNQETLEKQIEAERLRRDNAKGALDLLVATEVAYKNIEEAAKNAPGGSKEKPVALYIQPKIVVPDGEKEVDTIAEYFAEQTKTDPPVLRPIIKPDYTEADLGETTLLERAEVLGGKIGEAISSPAAQAIGSQLQAASEFTAALVEVVDDGTKEGFEASKKYKIAEVITSATQASFQAFAAAQQFGPILGPILGTAQVAAIAAASSRAISDIKSGTFDGSAPSSGNVSAPATIFTAGTQTIGGATGTVAPSGQMSQPVRAYVIAGDVSNGLEAETLLQARRQFP